MLLKQESDGYCAYCNKPLPYTIGLRGYKIHCNSSCVALDPKVKEKSQQTCLDKYGVKFSFQSDNNKEKSKQTCIEKYGVEYNSQIKEVQEKRKQTFIRKYGVDNPFKSEEIKEKIKKTNREKYGCDWYISSESYKKNTDWETAVKKQFETKKKNGTLNTSKMEKKAITRIKSIFPDAITSYNSDIRYPWHCDIYVPSIDLFIEFNFHWTHGGHWFDKNNSDDIAKLEVAHEKSIRSKYWKKFIHVWTKLDVEKRKVARKNNLNYIVFWEYTDIDLWETLNYPTRKDWKK